MYLNQVWEISFAQQLNAHKYMKAYEKFNFWNRFINILCL